jgi:hypothetical protein
LTIGEPNGSARSFHRLRLRRPAARVCVVSDDPPSITWVTIGGSSAYLARVDEQTS